MERLRTLAREALPQGPFAKDFNSSYHNKEPYSDHNYGNLN